MSWKRKVAKWTSVETSQRVKSGKTMVEAQVCKKGEFALEKIRLPRGK